MGVTITHLAILEIIREIFIGLTTPHFGMAIQFICTIRVAPAIQGDPLAREADLLQAVSCRLVEDTYKLHRVIPDVRLFPYMGTSNLLAVLQDMLKPYLQAAHNPHPEHHQEPVTPHPLHLQAAAIPPVVDHLTREAVLAEAPAHLRPGTAQAAAVEVKRFLDSKNSLWCLLEELLTYRSILNKP
jgi:hypothetical protein